MTKYKITVQKVIENPNKTYDDKETIYEQTVEGETETLVEDVIKAVNSLL
jgi:hypothetical protein